MARKTTNRSTFTVSTAKKAHPTVGLFQQTQFTGLCDVKNDIQVDQNSFAKMKNAFVDRNGVLVTRPPVKKDASALTNIIKTWTFGNYTFLLRKYIIDANGNEIETTDGSTFAANTKKKYVLSYTGTDIVSTTIGTKLPNITWSISATTATWSDDPAVFATAIEDKIFFWISGVGIYDFNTVGYLVSEQRKRFFESAEKYLYIPVKNTIANGVSVETESNNVLSESYINRYLYSSTIQYSKEDLLGSSVDVRIGTLENESSFISSDLLYRVTIQEGSQYTLLYPKEEIDRFAVYDVIETSTGEVFLKHSGVTGSMAVSFGGRVYTTLPNLAGVIGHPVLSKDGRYVLAFTENYLYRAKIVSDGAEDDEALFSWVGETYKYGTGESETFSIDVNFKPCAVFMTENVGAFIVKRGSSCCLIRKYYNASAFTFSYTELMFGTHNIIVNDTLTMCMQVPTVESTQPTVFVQGDSLKDGSDNTKRAGLLVVDDDHLELFDLSSYFELWSHQTGAMKAVSVSISPSTVAAGYDTEHSVYCLQYTSGSDSSTTEIEADLIRLTYKKSKATGEPPYNYTYSMTVNKTKVEMQFNQWTVEDSIGFSFRQPILSEDGSVGCIGSKALSISPTTVYYNSVPSLYESVDAISSGDTRNKYQQKPYCIYKVSTDGLSIDTGAITVGSTVVLVRKEYADAYDVLNNDNTRYIVSMGSSASGTIIHSGDSFTLTPPNKVYTFPANSYGNKTSSQVTKNYQSQPAVSFTGGLFYSNYYPVGATSQGLLFNAKNKMWTSIPSTTVLALDKYVNVSYNNSSIITDLIPTHCAFLEEYHFAISDPSQGFLIESTVTKRNDNREFLLYLPKINEQRFAGEVTALHNISDEILGVFTEDAVWRITSATLSDGTTTYTKPIKTMLPLGCRFGSDVITMPDGQTILVTTRRGVAAISPQDFVATTEPSVSYISDRIWQLYQRFYHDKVERSSELTKVGLNFVAEKIDPMIKIRYYGFYIIFYKLYDRTMLFYDTRTNTWWVEEVQYPIRDVISAERLTLVLQIDFTPVEFNQTTGTYIKALPTVLPKYGVEFLWSDAEFEILYTDDTFPSLIEPEDEISYDDSVVSKTATVGSTTKAYKALRGDLKDGRLTYGTSLIEWELTSQRLYLGYIDYYKAVRGLIVTAKGQPTPVHLNYKVFRELTHPEIFTAVDFRINDLRTLLCRVNAMHVANFQYQFTNITPSTEQTEAVNQDVLRPIRLDAVSVKYEVKEMVRT